MNPNEKPVNEINLKYALLLLELSGKNDAIQYMKSVLANEPVTTKIKGELVVILKR